MYSSIREANILCRCTFPSDNCPYVLYWFAFPLRRVRESERQRGACIYSICRQQLYLCCIYLTEHIYIYKQNSILRELLRDENDNNRYLVRFSLLICMACSLGHPRNILPENKKKKNQLQKKMRILFMCRNWKYTLAPCNIRDNSVHYFISQKRLIITIIRAYIFFFFVCTSTIKNCFGRVIFTLYHNKSCDFNNKCPI